MASTPQDPQQLLFKRKLVIGGCTLLMPGYYLFKNRNTFYKGSKLVKEFYLKELVARSVMGFFIGVAVSAYFYGAGPSTKKAVLGEEDKIQIDGKEVEKTSLEYAIAQKKRFHKKNDFLPGKIRDD